MAETPMVERVAEAMYEGFQRAIAPTFGPDWKPIPFAQVDGLCRRYYFAAAREGIEAMRSPTPTVIAAVENMAEERYNAAPDMLRWHGEDVWAAGIDAALAAPDEGRERRER